MKFFQKINIMTSIFLRARAGAGDGTGAGAAKIEKSGTVKNGRLRNTSRYKCKYFLHFLHTITNNEQE